MRLINTTDLTLREFGGNPPPYAILSHTWGEGEVTFWDMMDLPTARTKAGFSRIKHCCEQALRDRLDWAWVDTCCIDKSSSAELSETINSMFSWYERSMKCYALLSDVNTDPSDISFTDPQGYINQYPVGSEGQYLTQYPLFTSRWWRRGWTLQELIAPRDVEFYNRAWQYLISKQTSARLIHRFSGIITLILNHTVSLETVSVAQRMSWASNRYTTREEDMAYCLLGIFNVHMPLLYGEGAVAFQRLQHEILAATEDYTLLLWGLWVQKRLTLLDGIIPSRFPASPNRSEGSGFSACNFHNIRLPLVKAFASSPRDFDTSQQPLVISSHYNMPSRGDPPQVTSRGLRVPMFLQLVTQDHLITHSRLASALQRFWLCVAQEGLEDFSRWVHSSTAARMRDFPLYFGAFESYIDTRNFNVDVDETADTCLPCVLLIGLSSQGHSSNAYVRVMRFFCWVLRSDMFHRHRIRMGRNGHPAHATSKRELTQR
ncbi:putative HET domain-containing protein [Triangularia verruculosa]|uniref:HET domain-containing protein n=1 Tax=Triangularia verruculosa TaxID=2587418 RepID=A0AAN6XR76_9PEZI|nr:putative HET domain-containing protein [Triangularia verruculosa]